MFAALIMRRRPEFSRRRRLEFYPLDVAVEREIKIQPRLLAIRNDVEARSNLIVDRRDHGVILNLTHIGSTEYFEVLAGKLEPAGKRITANDRAAKRRRLHGDGERAGQIIKRWSGRRACDDADVSRGCSWGASWRKRVARGPDGAGPFTE